MVVDGFKVFAGYGETTDPRVALQPQRNVAHQILDKFGIVIGPLGDPLFVRPLQEAVNGTGSLFLGQQREGAPDNAVP